MDVNSAGELSTARTTTALLSDLEEYTTDEICNVESVNHIWTVSDLFERRNGLEEHYSGLEKYAPRKCVVFAFGGGEDVNDRCTTRIGGLPFWPRELEWPRAQEQIYFKQFIGQFDFRDITWPEPLPGDILTIHYDYDWDGEGRFKGFARNGGATLTWHDSKTTKELIERSDLPKTDHSYENLGPYYTLPIEEIDYKSYEDEWQPILTIHGMKIGGHSQLFGDNFKSLFSHIKNPVFLCSIGHVELDERTVSRHHWLPPKENFEPEKAGEVIFLDVGHMIILYEQGNPENLYWLLYLP